MLKILVRQLGNIIRTEHNIAVIIFLYPVREKCCLLIYKTWHGEALSKTTRGFIEIISSRIKIMLRVD